MSNVQATGAAASFGRRLLVYLTPDLGAVLKGPVGARFLGEKDSKFYEFKLYARDKGSCVRAYPSEEGVMITEISRSAIINGDRLAGVAFGKSTPVEAKVLPDNQGIYLKFERSALRVASRRGDYKGVPASLKRAKEQVEAFKNGAREGFRVHEPVAVADPVNALPPPVPPLDVTPHLGKIVPEVQPWSPRAPSFIAPPSAAPVNPQISLRDAVRVINARKRENPDLILTITPEGTLRILVEYE